MKQGRRVVLTVLLVLMSAVASAAASEHLGWGQQLHAAATACPPGGQILNVSYKIVNSVDSGTGTNDFGAPWWAVIDYVLQVKVSSTGADTFCATVKTEGSFVSVGGDGPGCDNDGSCNSEAGHLDAGVVGTFQGGYTETFSGTFDPGSQRTRGSLGTFDHDCDPAQAGGGCDGSGVTRWLNLYFSGVSGFDFDEWWGWVYHAGSNGSWVNAIDGNRGNIIGE
jgi:hypothetical protein